MLKYEHNWFRTTGEESFDANGLLKILT